MKRFGPARISRLPALGKVACELGRNVLDRQRNRLALLRKDIVPDKKAAYALNISLTDNLPSPCLFNEEADCDTEVKLRGGEYVALKGSGFCAIDRKDGPNDQSVGLVGSCDFVGSVLLDLPDYSSCCQRLDIGSDCGVLENRDRNAVNALHVGWGKGTQSIADASGQASEQNQKQGFAHLSADY